MKARYCVVILAVYIIACKKPYAPPAINASYNYLVVEGVINTGSDSTIIKLSRTVPISSVKTYNPELNAQITVENNQNGSFPLKQTGGGFYASAPLNLDTIHQYRLRIKTADGQEYLSDFVKAKASQPIDSITNEFTSTAENIYSYAHDITHNTRYYRWDYIETYKFVSYFATNYIYKDGDIRQVTPEDQITTCYVSDTSSAINIASTANLAKDVINRNPVTQVLLSTNKLKVRYSILVKQYALTADAYEYYEQLKKNTQDIGTIFDSQPSSNVTNIHCITNTKAAVIGYVTAGASAQARIFIDRAVIPVPDVNIGTDYSSICGIGSVEWMPLYFPLPQVITLGTEIPLDTVRGVKYPHNDRTHHGTFSIIYATPQCADCTTYGSNQQPSFWK